MWRQRSSCRQIFVADVFITLDNADLGSAKHLIIFESDLKKVEKHWARLERTNLAGPELFAIIELTVTSL